MDKTKQIKKRHSVSVRCDVYSRIKSYGMFGESFSQLLNRLLDSVLKLEPQGEKTHVE